MEPILVLATFRTMITSKIGNLVKFEILSNKHIRVYVGEPIRQSTINIEVFEKYWKINIAELMLEHNIRFPNDYETEIAKLRKYMENTPLTFIESKPGYNSMKVFNLNNYVYVQITKYGREYLEKNFEPDFIKHCIDAYKIEINDETWWKIQAHKIADYFGNATWIASHAPIKSNILIPELT